MRIVYNERGVVVVETPPTTRTVLIKTANIDLAYYAPRAFYLAFPWQVFVIGYDDDTGKNSLHIGFRNNKF